MNVGPTEGEKLADSKTSSKKGSDSWLDMTKTGGGNLSLEKRLLFSRKDPASHAFDGRLLSC